MRKRIYRMVHIYDGGALSTVYKWFMIITIVASLIPLTFKEHSSSFITVDAVCLCIYVADYILRWVTADYKFNRHHWKSFARFPFRFISVIDFLAIFGLVCPYISDFAYSDLAKALTVFRLVRIFKYSKNIRAIGAILKKSRTALTAVGSLAVGYIVFSAIVIYNVEPNSFNTFFDAIYWATVSLTTVGYGDLYPVTFVGRCVAMVSSFFGIAIVALPAGVVTAEYLNGLKENNSKKDE